MKLLLLLTIVLQAYQFQLKNKKPVPSKVSITISDVITVHSEYEQVYQITSSKEDGDNLIMLAVDELGYPCVVTVEEDVIEIRYSEKLWFKYWVREL